jgi:hypothetical protein
MKQVTCIVVEDQQILDNPFYCAANKYGCLKTVWGDDHAPLFHSVQSLVPVTDKSSLHP